MTRRTAIFFGALGAGCLVLFVLDLASGSVRIPLGEALRALIDGTAEGSSAVIMRVFRLPKALTAVLAGTALAVSGLILQTVFRNPLAGPDSLGVGAGASIGVALLILATGPVGSSLLGGLGFAGYAALALAASAGAAAVLVLVLLASRKFEHGVTLLLVGLMIGYLTGSLVSLLVYFGTPQKVQLYLGWTYGSFSGVRVAELPIFALAVVIGFALTFRSSKTLNALFLGERFAVTLGVRVKGARTRLLASAAILAGVVTAFCGPIAFLGIAAPQAARRIFRSSDHSILIPASALCGALIALAADIVSQAPGGGSVLPINPLLALVGAPFILLVFLRGAGSERGGSR
jgi:iron complex transport system permease protein